MVGVSSARSKPNPSPRMPKPVPDQDDANARTRTAEPPLEHESCPRSRLELVFLDCSPPTLLSPPASPPRLPLPGWRSGFPPCSARLALIRSNPIPRAIDCSGSARSIPADRAILAIRRELLIMEFFVWLQRLFKRNPSVSAIPCICI